MIDLHAHILPNLDDGPRGWEESLEMCRMAFDDGIRTIVATPHTLNGVYKNNTAKIKEQSLRLQALLDKNNISLNILPGSDVRIYPALTSLVENGEALTVNDNKRYIILELPDLFPLPAVKQLVLDLIGQGITPVISHPERVSQIQQDSEVIYELLEKGALSQVTAMSVTGEFGKGVKGFVEKMLKYDMVHIIATDCHDVIRRPPILSGAVEMAARIVGREKALAMVTTIPQAVIEGKTIKASK
ncbi:MAG: CpsB/CapC family capsule biosynthesis tyrosine phosphatase [Deltaproteobacteria bacterium]